MKKFKFSLSILGAAATLLAIAPFAKANEIQVEATSTVATEYEASQFSELPEFNSPDSYSATDLLPSDELISQRPIDLDSFCARYPFNSRCVNRPIDDEIDFEIDDDDDRDVVLGDTRGWAITPNISTLGLGIGVTKRISPRFNASVGVNGLPFDLGIDVESDESNLEYDTDLDLFSVSAIGRYYPSANSGFHLAGGVIFNDFEANGDADVAANADVVINGTPYNASDNGAEVNAEASFENDIAPYLGIGWGNPVGSSRFSVFANLGVMYTGSPDVTVEAMNFDTPVAQIDLDAEADEIEDEIDILGGFYPVLTLGVSYQFQKLPQLLVFNRSRKGVA